MPEQITMAMNPYFNGEPSLKVAQSLILTGIKVSHVTIQGWNQGHGTGCVHVFIFEEPPGRLCSNVVI